MDTPLTANDFYLGLRQADWQAYDDVSDSLLRGMGQQLANSTQSLSIFRLGNPLALEDVAKSMGIELGVSPDLNQTVFTAAFLQGSLERRRVTLMKPGTYQVRRLKFPSFLHFVCGEGVRVEGVGDSVSYVGFRGIFETFSDVTECRNQVAGVNRPTDITIEGGSYGVIGKRVFCTNPYDMPDGIYYQTGANGDNSILSTVFCVIADRLSMIDVTVSGFGPEGRAFQPAGNDHYYKNIKMENWAPWSWPPGAVSWQPSTAYSVDQYLVSQSGLKQIVYRVTTAGVSGLVAPTFESGSQADGTAIIRWVQTNEPGSGGWRFFGGSRCVVDGMFGECGDDFFQPLPFGPGVSNFALGGMSVDGVLATYIVGSSHQARIVNINCGASSDPNATVKNVFVTKIHGVGRITVGNGGYLAGVKNIVISDFYCFADGNPGIDIVCEDAAWTIEDVVIRSGTVDGFTTRAFFTEGSGTIRRIVLENVFFGVPTEDPQTTAFRTVGIAAGHQVRMHGCTFHSHPTSTNLPDLVNVDTGGFLVCEDCNFFGIADLKFAVRVNASATAILLRCRMTARQGATTARALSTTASTAYIYSRNCDWSAANNVALAVNEDGTVDADETNLFNASVNFIPNLRNVAGDVIAYKQGVVNYSITSAPDTFNGFSTVPRAAVMVSVTNRRGVGVAVGAAGNLQLLSGAFTLADGRSMILVSVPALNKWVQIV